MRSLRNRLTFAFSAIVLAAIAGLYLYVVPQLERHRRQGKLRALAHAARTQVKRIKETVGSSDPNANVDELVNEASLRSGGARVSLLQVARAEGDLQLNVAND